MAAYEPPSKGLSTWHPAKVIAVGVAGGMGFMGVLSIVTVLLVRHLLGR